MKNRLKVQAALVCLLALASMTASGAPRTWFVNLTYDDGATAAGSFVYDAATTTFSAISITSTAGPVIPGATYSILSASIPSGNAAFSLVLDAALPSPPGNRLFNAGFTPLLSTAGDTVSLSAGLEGPCRPTNCVQADPPFRRIVNGSATTIPPVPTSTAIPTMTVYGLGLTILGLLLVASRRLRTSAKRR